MQQKSNNKKWIVGDYIAPDKSRHLAIWANIPMAGEVGHPIALITPKGMETAQDLKNAQLICDAVNNTTPKVFEIYADLMLDEIFTGVEMNPVKNISTDPEEKEYTKCEDAEADLFSVYIRRENGTVLCVGDFSEKGDALKFQVSLIAAGRNMVREPDEDSAFGFSVQDVVDHGAGNCIYITNADAKQILSIFSGNADMSIGVSWDNVEDAIDSFYKQGGKIQFHNEELFKDLENIKMKFTVLPTTQLQTNAGKTRRKSIFYIEVGEDSYTYDDEDEQMNDFYMLQRFLASPEKLELVDKTVELTTKLFKVADASDQDRTFIDELCDKYGLLETEAYSDSQRVALGSEEFYNAISYDKLLLFYNELYARVVEIEKKAGEEV